MPLMVTPRCCCIRSANATVLALCSRCRAKQDPEFRRRCSTEFNKKPSAPNSTKKCARNRMGSR